MSVPVLHNVAWHVQHETTGILLSTQTRQYLANQPANYSAHMKLHRPVIFLLQETGHTFLKFQYTVPVNCCPLVADITYNGNKLANIFVGTIYAES